MKIENSMKIVKLKTKSRSEPVPRIELCSDTVVCSTTGIENWLVLAVFLFLMLNTLYFIPNTTSAATLLKAPVSNNLGLVGYWTLDGADINWATGKAFDRSGQGNSGNIANMSTTSSPVIGKLGQALKFDGVNDYVDVSTPASLNITSVISACAWVFRVASPANAMQVVSKGYDGTNTQYQLFSDFNNSYKVQWGTFNGAQHGVLSNSISSLNTWEHWCGTFNGSTYFIYKNGILDNSANDSQAPINTGGKVEIGSVDDNGPANQFWQGFIDDVRIYKRTLSVAEIKNLYQSGSAKINSTKNNKLTSGLLGLWSFDGSDVNWATGKALDRSGQGNTGNIAQMSTSTAPVIGKLGQALNFDGVDDNVSLPNPSTYPITTPWTVSAWVFPRSTSNNNAVIFYGEQANNGVHLIIPTTTFWRVGFWGGTSADAGAGTVSLNTWQFMTGTFDGTNLRLYKNGLLIAGPTAATPAASASPVAGIGANNSGGSSYFRGSIDDARIYNRALSVAEVKQLYQAGQAKFNSSQNLKLTSGLVGLWSFDGADVNWNTNKATDRSGQGNSGNITNMSTSTAPIIGKLGQALNFDGVNDYIDVGNPAILRLTSSYTLSAWAKTNNSSAIADDDIVAKGQNTTLAYLMNFNKIDTGTGLFLCLASPDGLVANSGLRYSATVLELGQWYHVSCVYNAAIPSLDIYVNGKLDNGTLVNSVPSSIFNTGDNVVVGFPRGAGLYWLGSIDDVRIYNRALSATEVKQLYLIGK